MPAPAWTFDADAPQADFSPAAAALWWLGKGGLATGPAWERAHAICQANEGVHGCDLVHGLAHWIEGDLGNADYWYARAGERRGRDLAAEWDRLAAILG